MRIANVNEEANTPNYVIGLLQTAARKVCTNIAESLGIMHDSLYREIEKYEENTQEITKSLQTTAVNNLSEKEKYLILDDSSNNKQYAKEIEGLDIVFDSCIKKAVMGLTAVIAIVTDTIVKLPIDAEYVISKIFAGANYKSKSKVAALIIQRIIGVVPFDWVIADAHYATQYLMDALFEWSIKFLMKIPRNRIVNINGQVGQLQNILRLKKNNRFACVSGTIFNRSCYFYVLKNNLKQTVYLVSNELLTKEMLIKIYKIRWEIECFNRTAKQLLGFNECQMRSFKMQHVHLLFVLWAYALADIKRHKLGFENTEQAIRSYRIAKSINLPIPLNASGENLCYFA